MITRSKFLQAENEILKKRIKELENDRKNMVYVPIKVPHQFNLPHVFHLMWHQDDYWYKAMKELREDRKRIDRGEKPRW